MEHLDDLAALESVKTPPSSLGNLPPKHHSPISGQFSKAYFLDKNWMPTQVPTGLLPSIINPKSIQGSLAHWPNNDPDFRCLSCWHSHKQPKCFFSSLCDLPHLSLWRPPKGSTEEWLCYFKPHRMEKQIYEVCPRMRLNVEMTLTSRNRIFTPKLGFSRQLSRWKSHKDSAGLMTAVTCTVFSQHLETVAVNNFSLIFFL